MSQSIEVGSVLGGRYRITDHVVTSADQDLVFTGLDQVLNRRVTVLVASLENATQVASSARELATGERQDDVQVLDLGLSEGHTYLIAGGNPDPDVLLGLAYPQETYVEPFQTDTLGSEIFGSSRDAQAHEYDDDEAYYTELDEHIRADQEQHSRRPGFLNRLSDRLSERMNSSSDGSAARKAAGASALAAAGSAAKAKEDEKRRAEEAERQRLEEERRRAEEAERQRLEDEKRRAEEAERQRVEREREEAAAAERAERERREAEELERRRARQIEEDERRERAAAERRAAERAEREEREARQAEERAEMEQREADRRREAAVKAAAQESGKGRDGRTEQGRRAAADISTDPMPTVPAAGRGDDGSASDSARPRPAKAHRDEAAPKDDEATPKDTERQSPRRVRPAPRRALAAAAASGAGATAAGDAPRNADKANDVRRDGASSNGDGRDAGHGSEREPRADGRDASDEGRKDRSGRRGAAAAGVGAAAVGATAAATGASGHGTEVPAGSRRDADARDPHRNRKDTARGAAPATAAAAAHPDGPRDRRDPDDDRRSKTGGAGWLVALLLVLLLAVALIAGFFLLNQNRDSVPDDNQATASPTESTQPTDDGASPSEETSASPSQDEAPAEPASLVDIYREVPDAPTLESEHDDQLPNIIDGDPETYWQSYSYKRPNFGGYTRSMNFVIELEEARDIEKVTVESLASSAGQLAIGVASEDGLGDLRRGGEGTFVDGKAEVDITDDQGNAKYVVVTVTELPQLAVDNTQYAYGMRLSEITVE